MSDNLDSAACHESQLCNYLSESSGVQFFLSCSILFFAAEKVFSWKTEFLFVPEHESIRDIFQETL